MSHRGTFYVVPWATKVQHDTTVGNEFACCHVSTVSGDALAADPTQLVLAHVHWGKNWEGRERFEALPGVIPLGEPSDLVPAAAVPVLEALRQSLASTRLERVGIVAKGLPPLRDPTVPIDATHSVQQALRKAQPMFEDELF